MGITAAAPDLPPFPFALSSPSASQQISDELTPWPEPWSGDMRSQLCCVPYQSMISNEWPLAW
jgi:hypothetical protein